MAIYIELLMVAAVTIYIVDISGFTQSWRDALARWLKVTSLRPLKPFDCGTCMTWWVCIIYSACTGHFNLVTIACSALLSHLANPIGALLIFVREWIVWITNKLMP